MASDDNPWDRWVEWARQVDAVNDRQLDTLERLARRVVSLEADVKALRERNVVIEERRLRTDSNPIGRLLVKLAPGDAYSDPWSDLGAYAPVETERFLLGLFYVSAITKT
jgi:hypothetical protein